MIPGRERQLTLYRFFFAVSYLLIGAMLSYRLMQTVDSQYQVRWVANTVFDVLLVVLFLYYGAFVHIKAVRFLPFIFLHHLMC